MSTAERQTVAEQVAGLFVRLELESKRRNGVPTLTSGSYLGYPQTGTATVDEDVDLAARPYEAHQFSFEFGFTDNTLLYQLLLAEDTSADLGDPAMVQLALAAEQSNEHSFILAAQAIDWTRRSAADLVQVIPLALMVGAHGLAQQLALLGEQRFPEHFELKRYAQVLAPPRMIKRKLPPRPDFAANRDWIKEQGYQFRGRWVALRDGQLLATAASFDELADRFGETQGILFTRIF